MLAPQRLIPALAMVIVAGACDTTEPSPAPSRLEVVAGDTQTATVATALPVAPSVRVLSANGKAVPHTVVTFQLREGGQIARASGLTDSRGVAAAGVWTLGTAAGVQTLTARVEGISELSLTAHAVAGPLRSLRVVSGNGQSGTVGVPLPIPPVVRAADEYDNPLAGVPVTFAITGGDGVLVSTSAITGSDGLASAGGWVLGQKVGTHTLAATVPGSLAPVVTFAATAGPAEAAQLVVVTPPSTVVQNGMPLSIQPAVQVADRFGNAVSRPGLVVTASAFGARVLNAQATTDAQGLARFTSLIVAGVAGTYTLQFSATGLSIGSSPAATLITPGAPARLEIITLPASVNAGVAMTPRPVVEARDADGNVAANASLRVTANVTGAGTLTGANGADIANGRATFVNLVYNGTAPFRLSFTAPGVSPVTSNEIVVTSSTLSGCSGARGLTLNYALGQTARFLTSDPNAPSCLEFDAVRNRDQQFLVLVENMPRTGSYENGVFPGPVISVSVPFTVAVSTPGSTGAPVAARRATDLSTRALPPGMVHAWDFGDGPLYEYEPKEPAGGVPDPVLIRGGDRIDVNSANAQPAPGDTVLVYIVGVNRLGTRDGTQSAVIRHVSNELIIAEDVRLPTLPRTTGTFNTPIPAEDLRAIADAYSLHARAQGDLLFGGRYNAATEAAERRVIAVHTLMPSEGTWGYTFSGTNVFAFDFWAGTNGSTKGPTQHPLRNAHNLFMHEIAHQRHWGMLERAGRTTLRGNRWLVEGFARFSERLPIASYLLNQPDPSRIGNIVLPRYTEFGGGYYRDDVPTFLNAGTSMFDGYQSSSFVFDYFADQVAAAGRNWRTALADFLVNAGAEADLDRVISGFLPGVTFQQLFTRARIALYTDDLGPALPPWTQYLQYQLRASRPVGTTAAALALEPRNSWAPVVPGTSFNDIRAIESGGAWGYLIDGANLQAATGRVLLDYTSEPYGVISITRIR